MTKQEFKELVAKGKVVLDGATGSNLMKAGMPRGVCTESWVLEVCVQKHGFMKIHRH